MLELQHAGLRWNSSRSWQFRGLQLKLQPGDRIILSGDNGSGKSSLLLYIAGLLQSGEDGCRLEGRLLYCGQDVTDLPASNRLDIGMVFQDPDSQFCTLTARDELQFSLDNLALPPQEVQQRLERCAEAWGLQSLIDRRIDQLSGGQKQLLALAAVMIQQPKILLLDEIASQLDPWQARMVWAGVERMLQDQPDTAMLCVDHSWNGPVCSATCRLRLQDGALHEVPGLAAASAGDGCPDTRLAGLRQQVAEAARELSGGGTDRSAVLAAEGISFGYRGGPLLWSDVHLQVAAGQVLAVLGGNGSGKSSLLLVLAGVLKPVAGRVHRPRHRLLVPQNPEHLFVHGRVAAEAAACSGRLRTSRRSGPEPQALLQRAGLAGHAQHSPFQLSHGQKRRLNLVVAERLQPELLLLDEPSQGQDPVYRDRIITDIRRHADRGAAVVIATHDWELAGRLADEVLVCS
ncbi:ATP-binding cassette domain-containing protein [Spirochaeta africana]|uniref:ATPase component of various ABC-type transport systems with duplicated ATPase domain n=1 Tax=Spirochaeta africana (strain ATCC 700263 / DSM 8902 / Z-7692) TaxID=889378 RepID=H9ULD4_SPIAZ|nr:ABC transporter ATP-binding protein [Spirochaeta africana]AFG38327.1 ATPase component of various ABC-type transport systems with duplicated ATPase domain [Spirochaeta africana DSM 8902]